MVRGTDIVGRGAPGWARAALLSVLLLALSWQGYVVATHAHPPLGVTAARADSAHRAPAHERRPIAPETCPLCQQISVAAAYLPAPPVAFAAPLRALAWYGAAAALRRLPHPRSHAWQSRGPPPAPAFPA